jgi:hypothetical protein
MRLSSIGLLTVNKKHEMTHEWHSNDKYQPVGVKHFLERNH